MNFLHDATNWVFISFVIFAVLFLRFGWKGVLAKLDGRIAEIRNELDTASRLRAEAEAMLAQYQAKHRDAMKEAEEITARARAQAQTIREKAEADLRESLARRERQLEDRLTRIGQSAEAELRAATAEIALRAANTVIHKGLDAKAQGALVDKSVAAIAADAA